MIVALSYGHVWVAAKIMGYTFRTAVQKLEIKAVIGIAVESTGISAGAVTAALCKVFWRYKMKKSNKFIVFIIMLITSIIASCIIIYLALSL